MIRTSGYEPGLSTSLGAITAVVAMFPPVGSCSGEHEPTGSESFTGPISRQPPINQPPTSHQPSATVHQPPTASHQPPTANHRPSATNHQPPTTNRQPSANHQPTNHRQPSANHQAAIKRPSTSNLPPTVGHELVAAMAALAWDQVRVTHNGVFLDQLLVQLRCHHR